MFEGISKTLSTEIRQLSNGKLNCLPYSRALLDCLAAMGIQSDPLVVRAVIFGKVEGLDWEEMLKKVSPRTLFEGAVNSSNANGWLELKIGPEGQEEAFRLPYRTLGYTHGNAPLGDYDEHGTWSGHLVVLVTGGHDRPDDCAAQRAVFRHFHQARLRDDGYA